MSMKQCTRCKVKKALSLFSGRKEARDRKCYWCRECVKQYAATNRERQAARAKAWRIANPARKAYLNKAWNDAHPGRQAKYNKAWYTANKESNRERRNTNSKAWYIANKVRATALIKAWRAANPGKERAHQAKRRATKLKATPPWADLTMIASIYTRATKRGLTVDHIIPLKHPLVCGLHVPWNLRPLTRSKNSAKGNRWEQL